MKINVHAGHNPDGKTACGAVGLIKESTEARKVKKLVIQYLKSLGHTVYDCTCDNGTSQKDVLKKIVNKCNDHNTDLDVSIHFNSDARDKKGNGKSTGVEVLIQNSHSKAKSYATKICNEIAKLGFKNRGVKVRDNLYVLNKTKAPALLVECCFVDDKDDVKLYSADTMAKAIVKGITGKTVEEKKGTTVKKEENKTNPKKDTSYKVKVTANLLNVRKEPNASSKVVDTIKKNEVYTILSEKNGWGKLKSGAGWIKLSYTKKV